MPPLTQPLRIALVCLHTSPYADPGSGDAGGMNVVVRHQAEALGSLGHSVVIITRRTSRAQPTQEQVAPGVTLRFLEAGPARPVAKGDHESFIEEFSTELAKLEPFDIVHSHHWFSGMAALPVARAWGAVHVQSFHSIAAEDTTDLSHGERAESPGRMRGEAYLAQESDSLVAISAAEASTITERLHGAKERTVIVFPGVDSAVFVPADAIADAAYEDPGNERGYVLVAARLQPLKGLDLAIAAVAAVPESLRPTLVIAGAASEEYADYVSELTNTAALLGLNGGLRLVGPQSRVNLALLFRSARLVLVPSHSETYGLVVLEAAASGVPVIAAASGGLREAVVHDVTGLVMKTRDPVVWGESIANVLSDPVQAKRLSTAARDHAVQLSWERSALSLATVYRNLLVPQRN